ncbi:MAG: competence/damage-inducible protein A [Vulcanimicrobiaceae bacterium]
MSNVELIAVGTELLLGQLVDTNTAFIAAQLAQVGIDVYATHAVGDNRGRIARAISDAWQRSDGVILTGGLGPTVDDLTKEAICDALGVAAEFHEPSLQTMEAMFAALGRPMRENNRRQAYLPQGSTALPNPHGTAPGVLAFRGDGKFVAALPGVPGEMRPMLLEQLLPRLRQRFALEQMIVTRVLHTVNLGESEIDHRIVDLFERGENPKIAVLAHDALCDVKIMAKAGCAAAAQALIADVEPVLSERLKGFVYGVDEMTLEGAVHKALRQLGSTLAVAESCTGGRIAAALTAVPGASRSFVGAVVAYDNAVKESLLDVDADLLAREGAVSEATVRAMALGVRRRLGSDVGLATTGVAGPDGGTSSKPVGLVWLGLALPGGRVETRELHIPGDRARVASRATIAALGLAWKQLAASLGSPG